MHIGSIDPNISYQMISRQAKFLGKLQRQGDAWRKERLLILVKL